MSEQGTVHEQAATAQVLPRQVGQPTTTERDPAPTGGLPIRLRGLVLALLGFGIAYALVAVQKASGSGMIAISGVPGALGLAGLIELISGYPFYQVAQKWDAMHPLVRLLLGLVIIVASVPLLIIILTLAMKP